MPKFLKITLLITVSLVIIGFIFLQWRAAEEGDEAPEIQAELRDGSNFKLSDLRGSYVLLNFWGSWCGPCRAENPELVRLHATYGDQLKIVTVALEKEASRGWEVAKMDSFTWKHQLVEESSLVMLSSSAQKYGVTEIPSTFLISPDGILLGKKTFGEIEKIIQSKN
jgi:thiol-disulfide isomerase/thioredoxin